MRTRTIPLLNYVDVVASLGGSPWKGPEMPRSIYDALVVVTVEAITGAPATATITPGFDVWHSVVGGNTEEVINGGVGASPAASWFPIAAASNPSLVPDGDFPAALDVHAATVAAPIATFKRIAGGFPWRFSLAFALTGGAAPSMRVSAIAYIREGYVGGFDRVESGA